MKRESVKSSNLASIGYDETNNILEIEFNHGGVYQYLNVPLNVYQELINEGIDVKIQQCEEVFPLGTPKDLEQSTCKIHMWKPQW